MKKQFILILIIVLFSGCVVNNELTSPFTASETAAGNHSGEASAAPWQNIQTGAPSSASQTVDCKDLENRNAVVYECSSHEDCMPYIDKCCSLLSKAINKRYGSCVPEVDAAISDKPCNKSCNTTDVPTMAICANNTCMPIFQNLTQSFTTPTASCSTDGDCELSLCNCQCQEKGFDKGICAMIMDPDTCLDNVGITGCKCVDGKCNTV